jgi:hypothetical protein
MRTSRGGAEPQRKRGQMNLIKMTAMTNQTTPKARRIRRDKWWDPYRSKERLYEAIDKRYSARSRRSEIRKAKERADRNTIVSNPKTYASSLTLRASA